MGEGARDHFIDVEILFRSPFLLIKVTNSYNGQYPEGKPV